MLGFLAAGLLVAVAASSLSSPRAAGEAALSRLTGEVAEAVAGEWQRLRRAEDWTRSDEPGAIRWWGERPAAPRPAVPAVVPDSQAARGDSSSEQLFDVLMDDAAARELGGDLPGALSTACEALQEAETPQQRSASRLRTIQLARKAGEHELVRAEWSLAAAGRDGTSAQGEVSLLLFSALAAADSLDASEREAARELLVELWIHGELALPNEAAELTRASAAPDSGTPAANEAAPSPLRLAPLSRLESLAAALQALVPERSDVHLEQDLAARRLRAVTEYLGQVPQVPPPGLQNFTVCGADVFVTRQEPDGTAAGRFLLLDDLRAALMTALSEHGLLPDGFRVDLSGTNEELGQLVRGRTPLLGDALGFHLRHADAAGMIASEGRRMTLLRTGLLVVGALCLLAGFTSYRAVLRERRLQQLKVDFIANVSHELRTPLSSILLMADNLEQGRVTAPQAPKYHSLIRREAHRLRRLVDDVLDFSRLDRGEEARLALEETRLPALLARVADEARELALQAGAQLRFESAEVPATGLVDGEALHRALLNLIQNALVHGGGEDVQVVARGGAALTITVADRGPGVPPEKREEIFEAFTQLETSEGKTRGTGLGLAIVREIARGHGGSVRVTDRADPTLDELVAVDDERQPASHNGRPRPASARGAVFQLIFPLRTPQPAPTPGETQ